MICALNSKFSEVIQSFIKHCELSMNHSDGMVCELDWFV